VHVKKKMDPYTRRREIMCTLIHCLSKMISKDVLKLIFEKLKLDFRPFTTLEHTFQLTQDRFGVWTWKLHSGSNFSSWSNMLDTCAKCYGPSTRSRKCFDSVSLHRCVWCTSTTWRRTLPDYILDQIII
jgi:hypothetical protein